MRNSIFSMGLTNFIVLCIVAKVTFATGTQVDSSTPTPIPSSSVVTGDATDVTSNSATLNGTVPLGTPAGYMYFEYGTTSGTYTSSITAGRIGLSDHLSANLSGLSPATTYYYRLVIVQKPATSNGYVYGDEKSFTTLEATGTPVPTQTTTATPTSTPECEIESIKAFPKRLKLTRGESREITVTLKSVNDCVAEWTTVTATVNKAGGRYISVTPASQITDEHGEAGFTITAGNNIGNAKVTFHVNEDRFKKTILVQVRK